MTRIFDKASDFILEASRGNILGVSTYNKFGRNTEIDAGVTADIWDGGHTGDVSLIWVAPTQARIHDIKSSSSDDDGNPVGDGARTIRIFGLKNWDTAESNEDIILNGTSNVATSNAYVLIHRMRVLTKGATNVNVGVITATAQSNNTITAQINAGKGQTQMCIYGIPSTQKVHMKRLYGNVNKAGGAAGLVDVTLLFNPEPDAELTRFLVRHTFGLQTVGTSALTISYSTPKILEGPGIIKIQVLSGTANMDVSAGFDLIIVDN